MGREIKRVSLDFEWPINSMIWKGYHNPYSGMTCKECDGTGMSPEYKALSDSWYSHLAPDGVGWQHNITQDEVQALVDAGRLMDFTRRPRNEEQARQLLEQDKRGESPYWLKEWNGYTPTADEVNEWSHYGLGHDGINHWICVEARAKRLGITETQCKCCQGDGKHWPEEKYKQLAEDWETIDPPAGEGYQLWSTTSEGTPMSPVFETPEELVRWLTDNDASACGTQTADYETWLKFICGPGWAPTNVLVGSQLKSGVAAVVDKKP